MSEGGSGERDDSTIRNRILIIIVIIIIIIRGSPLRRDCEGRDKQTPFFSGSLNWNQGIVSAGYTATEPGRRQEPEIFGFGTVY